MTGRSTLATGILVLLMAAGCTEPEAPQRGVPPSPAGEMSPAGVVGPLPVAGSADATRWDLVYVEERTIPHVKVATTQEEWDALWSQQSHPRPENVSFAGKVVYLVHARLSSLRGGFEIARVDVEENRHHIHIHSYRHCGVAPQMVFNQAVLLSVSAMPGNSAPVLHRSFTAGHECEGSILENATYRTARVERDLVVAGALEVHGTNCLELAEFVDHDLDLIATWTPSSPMTTELALRSYDQLLANGTSPLGYDGPAISGRLEVHRTSAVALAQPVHVVIDVLYLANRDVTFGATMAC